ncbi:MAG TPA: ABC transporter ATP-binding protein [Anaerolineaceae bacterium]|nr:ABC transporter ATP-binding protein [Longilinea sp.]HNZ13268.1 ABC transporter ATP-binding protein [Anaerolineaceae bacterium]HOG78234.1 ABC transporter ATP-binding protein [Anaerolineaceae bacterium]HQF61951.1 ABC transporter ATP-binding protein [Anaerolineaceae bacterium]HQH84972.1 ABC transporter ATP-binding protein [Anaerolineaceae bacterium]
MGFHGGWRGLINSPDDKPQITWGLLKRVLKYARPYRWALIGMLLLILAHTGLMLLTPLILRDLIDKTIPAGDVRRLIWLALALLLIPAVNGVINVVQRRLNVRVGEGVIYDLRMALYANLQRMSLRFFTNTKVGELMSRLNNDVVGAQNAISSTIVGIITQIVQAVAVLTVMLTLEWRLTLISVVILPLFILAARLLGNRLRDMARKQMEANAQMNAMMNETLNIGGALLVKLFGRKQLEVDRFGQRAAQVRDLGVQRALIGSVFMAIIGLISAVGSALVYGLGGYFVIQGAFTIGTIVAFGSYLGSLYGALQGLSNAPVEFATSMVSFERVFEVIDLPVDIPEKADAVALRDVRGEIIFDQVSFQYESGDEKLLSDVHRYGSMDNVTAVLSGAKPNDDEGEEPERHSQARSTALEEVSFRVQPGQLVALVGPSGAGKTTLTYLIPRLYDPSTGIIRIDGHDLRDITLESLSAQIGMVTQETYLFHDTIRTNLQYARLNASQEELEAACRVANIHPFIQDLPDGYDTIVGERGYRLSGGEKQRIALARVILKDPKILVLDEATSSLDSESEALIQDALGKVMAQRTSIVIAHRLSTILAADLILVIDRGRIVESGNHTSLLAQNGLYASLYQTQFRKDRA